MTRPKSPDPYVDAKLLGILLAGVFGQTRPECAAEARQGPEPTRRPSGVLRIGALDRNDDSKS